MQSELSNLHSRWSGSKGSHVWSCNLLCVTLVINYGISSASLFAANGPVEPLTADNFVSFIHNSPQVWLVNFYSAWCGHCQRLAPEYSRFASEIQDWKPVFGVAAVHCSDATNAVLCRNYDVRGFPTIKVFPPNSSLSEHGQQFESESRYFIPELLRYLMHIVNSGRADASWPQLGSIRRPAELLSGSNDKQVYIIVEDDASIAQNIALMVILDLLPQWSTVVVGRMRLNDARVYGLTDRGLFTVMLFKSLIPVYSNYDRNAIVSTIRSRNVANEGQQSEISTSTASPFTNTDSPHKDNVIPGLHMQDIESCIYYSLWIEVTARTSFNESALNALKAYVETVAKYLPGENHLMKFLHKTDVWLKHQRAPLSVDTWLNQITNTQSDDAYVSSRLRWTWCEGSRPQYRGYPCSLWMTFHTLTVNAYLQKLNNTSYLPTDVFTAIRGYVEHFLGCRECAGNFGRGASRVLDSGTNSSLRYLTQNDGAALWLWLSHNRANQRLHGDVTEDPSHPKIQFPSMEACATCWLDQSRMHWNETAVLAFLVEYYGAPYVIDDDIHDGPESAAVQSALQPSDSEPATPATCNIVNSEWTACSRSCDVGTSMQLSNENSKCETQLQVRLCLIRPCFIQFPDWTRSDWQINNCPRLGHTYRLASARSLTVGNCRTVQMDSWRICGICPPLRSGRQVCCRPGRTTMQLMDLQCQSERNSPGTPVGIPVLSAQVLVQVIEYCTCDENCSPDEL